MTWRYHAKVIPRAGDQFRDETQHIHTHAHTRVQYPLARRAFGERERPVRMRSTYNEKKRL